MSSSDQAAQIVHVLEVAGLAGISTDQLRELIIAKLPGPPRIVGELRSHQAVIIEARSGAERLSELLPPGVPVEVVELCRHYPTHPIGTDSLLAVLSEARSAHRLAVGATVVERAMQRGRLELLVVAKDVASEYRRTLHAVITRHNYRDTINVCELTRQELGQATGVRRAGCVGLLRGGRRYVSL